MRINYYIIIYIYLYTYFCSQTFCEQCYSSAKPIHRHELICSLIGSSIFLMLHIDNITRAGDDLNENLKIKTKMDKSNL